MMKMQVVSLCGGKSCCPVVEIDGDVVKIGEKGNLCILRKEEWETLKEKVKAGEL